MVLLITLVRNLFLSNHTKDTGLKGEVGIFSQFTVVVFGVHNSYVDSIQNCPRCTVFSRSAQLFEKLVSPIRPKFAGTLHVFDDFFKTTVPN